jgi:hypothetical protein
MPGTSRTRWRDRPRRTLRRWDLPREYGIYAITLVGAWVPEDDRPFVADVADDARRRTEAEQDARDHRLGPGY